MDVIRHVKVDDVCDIRHVNAPGCNTRGHHCGGDTIAEALDGLITRHLSVGVCVCVCLYVSTCADACGSTEYSMQTELQTI
jgi:hypothetical protein